MFDQDTLEKSRVDPADILNHLSPIKVRLEVEEDGDLSEKKIHVDQGN